MPGWEGQPRGVPEVRVNLCSPVRSGFAIAEIVVEVRGQLYTGPPKTRAGRRTVGLPRVVVEELAAHLGPVGPADAYVFTAEKGGVVWAYMGPRELQPPEPDYEWTRAPATHRYVSKTFENCNYLQALEGGLDTTSRGARVAAAWPRRRTLARDA